MCAARQRFVMDPNKPKSSERPIRMVQTINPQQPKGIPNEDVLLEQRRRNEQRPPEPKR